MDITRLSEHSGVLVSGLDLNALDDEARREIRNVFDTEHLVLFRQPGLTPEAQMEVLSLIGPLLDERGEDGNRGEEKRG